MWPNRYRGQSCWDSENKFPLRMKPSYEERPSPSSLLLTWTLPSETGEFISQALGDKLDNEPTH